jgi:ABC-type Fe3+-siderophore transport system permease subunit
LVLGGVIVGAVCAAVTTVSEALLPPDRRGLLMGWMFGRVPEVPEPAALRACAAAACGLAALGTWWGRSIDAAAMSDDEARSVGVNLGLVRTVLLVGADALRQWVDLGSGRLPLGALTAALGGVAFLVLLRRTAGAWGH